MIKKASVYSRLRTKRVITQGITDPCDELLSHEELVIEDYGFFTRRLQALVRLAKQIVRLILIEVALGPTFIRVLF